MPFGRSPIREGRLVAEDEVDVALVARRHSVRFRTAPGLEHQIAVTAKGEAEVPADDGVVDDEEDRPDAGGWTRDVERRLDIGGGVDPWQEDAELGPLARLAVHLDTAARLRHDAVRRGQPQPGSPVGLLRREERLEDA